MSQDPQPSSKPVNPSSPTLTLIGKGLTSDVYAWDEHRVIKVYHARVPQDYVEREFRITRALNQAGLPVPAAYEIIEQNGCPAILFERLRGISLFQEFEAKPWKMFSATRLSARLHHQLHRFAAPPELPSQSEQMERWLEAAEDFTEVQKASAHRCLAEMPSGNAVCHGDLHPENVILTERGPMIIDRSTGTRGHPLADVCRTAILLETAELPDDTPRHIRCLVDFFRRVLIRVYLKEYARVSGAKVAEILQWRDAQLAAVSAWRASRII